MATISNTPRPGYVWDSTDNVWYPIGTGPHTHADYITSGSAINPSIVDAKGDIIAATAADTVARLEVGANDTVLTADSSTATGLKWATVSAGGMTLLSTTTLSGATTTISGISGSYNQLVAFIYGVNHASNGTFYIAPNGSSSISNSATVYAENTSAYTIAKNNDYIQTPGNMVNSNTNNCFVLVISDYASTTNYKSFTFDGLYEWSTWTTAMNQSGAIQTNSAITSLVFSGSAGNLNAGEVRLYGVK